jgi:hypothetical protein
MGLHSASPWSVSRGRVEWIRASLAGRIWYETSVPVFLERYLLPLAAALTVLVAFTNPMNFDWTQRITGGLALLFAAYFVAHTAQKLNNPSPLPHAEAPTQPTPQEKNPSRIPENQPFGAQMVLPDGRTIISCSPEDLQSAFRTNTKDQFNRLLSGKWIKISGKIEDNLGNGTVIIITEGSPNIFLHFGRAWEDQLSVLSRGLSVTIRGKIAPAQIGYISLIECELL